MKRKRSFLSHLFVLFAFFSLTVQAVSLTPEQIQQFKNLPRAQQEAIAKQYGIDLSTLNGLGTNNNTQQNLNTSDQLMSPRQFQDDEDDFFSLQEKQFKPKKEVLNRFGYELFNIEATTFAPTNNTPVPAGYILGPGDTVNISLYGKQTESHEIIIDREGAINIPGMAPIFVTGLSYNEMKVVVKNEVQKQMIGVETIVSMGQLRTIRIFILGEAYQPGAYAMSSLSTITHALFISGGVTDIGSLRNIQLKRAGKVVKTLDIYDLLVYGNNAADTVLQAGDVIFIPTAGQQVTVTGKVKRPAIFEVKNNETYQDILVMAGGLLPDAYEKETIIERFTEQDLRAVVSVDLSKKENLIQKPVDGDIIKVSAKSNQFKESVLIIGAVERPGQYQWRPNTYITDYLKDIHSDFLPTADLNYALLIRDKVIDGSSEQNGAIAVYQFEPNKIISYPKSETNFLLKPRDRLVIFSRYESKAAESRLLEKYAYNEADIELLQRENLWKQYKDKQFIKFIEKEDELVALNEDELTNIELEQAQNSLFEEEKEEEKEETYYSTFSRHRLLAPIILSLKDQAGIGEQVQLAEISGRVKYPGIYPLAQNGRVKELIQAAGGLEESAYLDKAEITRSLISEGQNTVKHLSVNLSTIDSNELHNPLLRSRDRLTILPIPNWQENVIVEIKGEVRFPGSYTFRRGETLSSVVKRAGGLTDFADSRAAIFTRESLRIKERQQLAKLSYELRRELAARSLQPSSSLGNNYSDTNSLLNDLTKVRAVGRLVIDLPMVLNEPGENSDVKLENSDTLYIPAKQQAISVIGEVHVATSHLFNTNLSVNDYLERSGGFKPRADAEAVFIIKSDGSVMIPQANSWFAVDQRVQLEAGDTIVVPLDSEHRDNLELWASVTQIVYQVAIAIAAISNF